MKSFWEIYIQKENTIFFPFHCMFRWYWAKSRPPGLHSCRPTKGNPLYQRQQGLRFWYENRLHGGTKHIIRRRRVRSCGRLREYVEYSILCRKCNKKWIIIKSTERDSCLEANSWSMDFKRMDWVMCIINKRWAGARKRRRMIFPLRGNKMMISALILTVAGYVRGKYYF